MSNLYGVEASATDLALQFGVEPVPDAVVPSPVQPGKRGLVVRGAFSKRSMHVLQWGFREPAGTSSRRPSIVADLTDPMWDGMVPDPRYRCLIPVSALASPTARKAG